MSGSVGVRDGQVCPACAREDSVPPVFGLPSPELMDTADQGLVSSAARAGSSEGSALDPFSPLDR
jgi:hypothetical protein